MVHAVRPHAAPTARGDRPALCVINYNGARYLPTTLATLRERRDRFGDAVLVDDASTDDSIAVARGVWPDLRIVGRRRNGGPGAARNTGAARLKGPRVLFIDNDVVPESGCVAALEGALDADPRAVIAMPRVVYLAAPDRIQFEGGDAHPSGLQTLRNADRPRTAAGTGPPRSVTSLVSACFLIDRSRWGPHPLFDERLRIYLEDHELGVRASLRGLRLLVVPDAICRHGDGTPGVSIRETGYATPTRIRNTMLNRWQVLLKLYQGRTLLLLAPSILLFEAYQLAGAAVLGWLPHWRGAVVELVRMLPALRRRRREVRRLRRVPDAAVLRAGPHPFSRSLSRRRSVRILRGLLDVVGSGNWFLARRLLRAMRSVDRAVALRTPAVGPCPAEPRDGLPDRGRRRTDRTAV
ncbi:MAG: glycosyltransferase [Gemmatimonadota bacterium]